MDECGLYGAFEALELLQPFPEVRYFLPHPPVLGGDVLQLVGYGPEEVLDLSLIQTSETASELLAPDIFWLYINRGSPRNRPDKDLDYRGEQPTPYPQPEQQDYRR